MTPEFQATFAPIRFCFRLIVKDDLNRQTRFYFTILNIKSNMDWYIGQRLAKFIEKHTTLIVNVVERTYRNEINPN